MGIELDSRYQTEAYEAIQKSISYTGKAGIILPTGTGKTYLALKLIEDNLDKNQILYASPSPTINVRVRKLIRKTYDKEKAEEILGKVKFTTYAGLNKRYKNHREDMKEYDSDVIVLDEVHRSGAGEWGKAVDYLLENNEDAQLLGMTATPLRNDGQNMIEKRCGEVAYELKLSEAVARGVLKLPIYIVSRYIFEEDIKRLEEKLELVDDKKTRKELDEKLRNAKKQIKDAEGLKEILSKYLEENGKYLVFCNSGDDLEKIVEKARKEGWFDEINKNQTLLIVETSRKDSENAMALRRFEGKKGKDLRIIFSKNMLNEGIHVEEITGEIMLRSTKSYILFIQQLGRILVKDREDIPIVLDLVNNIRYFKDFRLEVQRIIRNAEERGDKRYDPKVLEQFKIIEEQEDFIKAFEEIESSLDGYLNRTSVSETLKIARVLRENGIELSEIQLSRTQNGKTQWALLKEIEQEGIDIGKIIEENGLDGNFKYGRKIMGLRNAYNGRGSYVITEEEKKEAKELGLIPKEKTSVIEQTLEIARILKANGIDLSEIQITRTQNGKSQGILLKEIEQVGIDIGKIIEENGLDGNFKYGRKILGLRGAYNGTNRHAITEEEKKEAEMLGLIPKEKTSVIAQTLEIARILKTNGVDLSKLTLTSKNGKKILLKEIKQEGIDIEKIIEENGLDGEFKYGYRITVLRLAHNGKGGCIITEEEKKKAKELGLIPEEKITRTRDWTSSI